MQALTLYLHDTGQPPHYEVSWEGTDVGEGHATCTLPFDGDPARRVTMLKALEAIRFQDSSFAVPGEVDWMAANGWISEDRHAFSPCLRDRIGTELFRSLFPAGSETSEQLKTSRTIALNERSQLHLQIKIDADTAKCSRLADYPWELLRDKHDFLANQGIVFSRYIAYEAARPSLPPVDQLNVLLVTSGAADPANGLARLPGDEADAIRDALAGQQRIRLTSLPSPTFQHLQTYLTEHRGVDAPHILHFDGHGFYGRACTGRVQSGARCTKVYPAVTTACGTCGSELPGAQGYILFEDANGSPHYVSARQLGPVLRLSSLGGTGSRAPGIALAVLTACRSGLALGQESIFNGVAQNLIQHAVPAVVAMLFSVRVDSAADFTRLLYISLAQRDSLVDAVSRGRMAMGADSDQWYRPVLYLRWKDNAGGQLFTEAAVLASGVQQVAYQVAAAPHSQALQQAAAAFRGDFDTAREQIELLSYYKNLHDHLHTLQYRCFDPITEAAKGFPDTLQSRRLLAMYRPQLQGVVADFEETRQRGQHRRLDTIDTSWIHVLQTAADDVGTAVDSDDLQGLQRALALIGAVLTRYPSQINQYFFSILENLRLPALERAMNQLHAALAGMELEPHTLREIGNGIDALSELHPRLIALITEHKMWQQIDTQLRTAAELLDHDMRVLGWYWPPIKRATEELYGISSGTWMTALRTDEGKLDDAVRLQDFTRAKDYFDSFQWQAARRFYNLDKELKEQCDQLQAVGTALSTLLEVIQ